MKNNIFREYDIRGIVGSEIILEEAYNLGLAIATYFKQEYPESTAVIIGHDARSHSAIMNDEISRAITDCGFNLIDIGLTPTPLLYFAVNKLNIEAGLTITASHNPKEYNGIKIWGAWGEKIQQIKNIYNDKNFYAHEGEKGSMSRYDAVSDYLDFMLTHFAHLKGITLNTIIDCGNGSAGIIMPELIKRMGWKNVTLLYPEVDGNFPNHEADPTIPENMRDVKNELTANASLTIGIGFDGDCDRMTPMTKAGNLVAGDKLLALYAEKIIKNNPGAPVVFDIKSSSSLIEVLEKWKAQAIISPSGHSLIKHAMKVHKALLGGELSCHFFFKDRYFGYDDGFYAALRLFEILHETEQSLEELLSVFPHKENSPEIRIKCTSDTEKLKIVEHVKTIFAARKDIETITTDGIRAHMTYGWGLVRASNTQPAISLRFESSTKEGLKQVKQDFYDSLTPFFDNDQLRDAIEL